MPPDLGKVLYVDRFGNLITGWRAAGVDRRARLRVGLTELARARTFCERPSGSAFWYENSLGLVEVAVNQGRADHTFGLVPGDDLGPPIY
jgi:S-adenosylmethionine hydrolase